MTLGNKLVSMTVSRKAGINPLNFILKKKITVKASPMKKKNCKTGEKKSVWKSSGLITLASIQPMRSMF